MTASSTDVRKWAREQGRDVSSRGAVPAHLVEEYEAAHPDGGVVQGEVLDSGFDMGVTEADFPPDDDGDQGALFDEPAAKPAAPKATRERKPRAVKPAGKKPRLTERIFGKRDTAKPKPRGPRNDLSDWAEETWSDLAWLAQPIPPLAKMLTIQAPFAGVMFDDAVKGTPVDAMLQPVAKASTALRALNGLAGPPVYVGMICATGRRVQLLGPSGEPLYDELGQPVMDYDMRTQMLFQGLRYSLLQMTKISELNAEQIQARTQASAERMRTVDAIIASIFDMPMPDLAPQPAYASPSSNGFHYPDESATMMDGTGADPGRM